MWTCVHCSLSVMSQSVETDVNEAALLQDA